MGLYRKKWEQPSGTMLFQPVSTSSPLNSNRFERSPVHSTDAVRGLLDWHTSFESYATDAVTITNAVTNDVVASDNCHANAIWNAIPSRAIANCRDFPYAAESGTSKGFTRSS
ncbi:hypothetical protein OSTOST_15398 [Ostertagia ostertagi]